MSEAVSPELYNAERQASQGARLNSDNYVDRGLKEGHFRGLGGGRGELPGEAEEAPARGQEPGYGSVGSAPLRWTR
jgi:hypothetical protein